MPLKRARPLLFGIVAIFVCFMALDYGLFSYAMSRQPADLHMIGKREIRYETGGVETAPNGDLKAEPDVSDWPTYPDGPLNADKVVFSYRLPASLPQDAILNLLNDSDYTAIYVGTELKLEYGKFEARRWTYSQERHQIELNPDDAGKRVYIRTYYHSGSVTPFTFYVAPHAGTVESLFFASQFRVVLPLSILLFVGIAGLLIWFGRPKEYAALWVSLMAFSVLPYCLSQNFASIRYVLWEDQSWVTYFGRVGIQVFVIVFLAYLRGILPPVYGRSLKRFIRVLTVMVILEAGLLVSSDRLAELMERIGSWIDIGLCLYFGALLLITHRYTQARSMRTVLGGLLIFLLFALKELLAGFQVFDGFLPGDDSLAFQFAYSSQIVWGTLLLILAFGWGAVLRVQEAREKYTRELELAHMALRRTHNAYERFVPKQFLEHLNRENIIDVRLGDQVRKKMTILFSDIRSFTTLSESMTPEETFQFLNEYLGVMEPIIAANGGFIDKYMGDGIMALFDRGVDDALRASTEMLRALRVFNAKRAARGLPPVEIGIGIHTGELMLGTLGGEGRMEGTVISDAVNTASRLEGLTKTLSAPFLISEETLQALDEPGSFHTRAIDQAQVKGRKERISVHEVMDADEPPLLRQKQDVSPLLQEGRRLMAEGRYAGALAVWERGIGIAPDDRVIRMWLNRCKEAQKGKGDQEHAS